MTLDLYGHLFDRRESNASVMEAFESPMFGKCQAEAHAHRVHGNFCAKL
ncbi:hypothetical protein [Azospirillum doebereinerae]